MPRRPRRWTSPTSSCTLWRCSLLQGWCLAFGIVRPPDPPPPPADQAYAQRLGAIAREHGVTHWGVARADVLDRAHRALVDRRAAGLADSMQFTYKNPQRSTDPRAAVRGARSVFVCALPYAVDRDGGDGDPAHQPAGGLTGEIARYAQADYYGALRGALDAVVATLRGDGWKAVAFADDNSLVDREVAYRAGLGWFGKNANLLISGAGSWFVLGSVVTTADLPASGGPVSDGCGSCERCVIACPTAAIVAPGVIDARRCLSWILQRPGQIPEDYRVAVGRRLYGCDDCQTSCPPTVVLGRRVATEPPDRRSHLDLVELLETDDEALVVAWGRWYLADRDPRWIRRNALVALGNALAEGPAPSAAEQARAEAVLDRYVGGIDALLADHARWARTRARRRAGGGGGAR